MTSYLSDAVEYYNNVLKERGDPRVEDFPLMSSPVTVLSILAAYYYFIYYAGPKFMEKRKPFDLKKVMVYYNLAQCIVNLWATIQGVKILFHPAYSLRCSPIEYSSTPFNIKITFLGYLYLIIKISDLCDTVFMVLRKNYRQVTFLHVYHHMGMVIGSWTVVKFIPGGHLCFTGFINCFVHTVMYFYYLLTAYDSDLKKSIWWKKHITELQMVFLELTFFLSPFIKPEYHFMSGAVVKHVLEVQFTMILLHHSAALLDSNCNYPKPALLIFMSQNFLMVYLFSKFYYETYIKPQKKA